MDIKQKVNTVSFMYGYRILVLVLDHFEYYEDYEVCKVIEERLCEIEKLLNIEINRKVDSDFIPDYIAECWKLNYSGDIALNNLPHYLTEALKIMQE